MIFQFNKNLKDLLEKDKIKEAYIDLIFDQGSDADIEEKAWKQFVDKSGSTTADKKAFISAIEEVKKHNDLQNLAGHQVRVRWRGNASDYFAADLQK